MTETINKTRAVADYLSQASGDVWPVGPTAKKAYEFILAKTLNMPVNEDDCTFSYEGKFAPGEHPDAILMANLPGSDTPPLPSISQPLGIQQKLERFIYHQGRIVIGPDVEFGEDEVGQVLDMLAELKAFASFVEVLRFDPETSELKVNSYKPKQQ